MSTSDQVRLLLFKDANQPPKSYSVSRFIYRLSLFGIIMLFLLIIAAIAALVIFYSHSLERAELLVENQKLKEYNAKVVQLEEALNTNRLMLRKMTELAGIDLSEYELYDDDQQSQTGLSLIGEIDTTVVQDSSQHLIPYGLPVEGYLSQKYRPSDENPKMRHYGIDIAVSIGKKVLATADGLVTFADWDSVFGYTVILEHKDGYKTMYGHNSELLVKKDDEVTYGTVIAISGSTGHSSAPHLHYEIRKNGKPVDPENFYTGK